MDAFLGGARPTKLSGWLGHLVMSNSVSCSFMTFYVSLTMRHDRVSKMHFCFTYFEKKTNLELSI